MAPPDELLLRLAILLLNLGRLTRPPETRLSDKGTLGEQEEKEEVARLQIAREGKGITVHSRWVDKHVEERSIKLRAQQELEWYSTDMLLRIDGIGHLRIAILLSQK